MSAATAAANAIEVHTTIAGRDVAAGMLHAQADRLTFRYLPEYVALDGSYDLTPSLPRSAAPFFFTGLGPFSDSAPDRWGRRLLARESRCARLTETERLLGVNDLTRQGAIRFFLNGEPTAGSDGVPPLSDLPALLDTADAVQQDRDVPDMALRRLYRATGSLGGARPKASVWDSGALWMAKFPKPNGDDWDIIGWEAVVLHVARLAGIDVPDHRVLTIPDGEGRPRTVLLTQRFDRVLPAPSLTEAERIPYISALTALSAQDGEGGDWLDIAEFTQESGGDTRELWRRAMLGAAIGNTDDHLRNHGFLRTDGAWHPSPAFDLNPEPYEPRVADLHQTALFGDPIVTVDALCSKEALDLFAVAPGYAAQWRHTLRSALAQAMPHARMQHIDAHSTAVMAPRFAHALDMLG